MKTHLNMRTRSVERPVHAGSREIYCVITVRDDCFKMGTCVFLIFRSHATSIAVK